MVLGIDFAVGSGRERERERERWMGFLVKDCGNCYGADCSCWWWLWVWVWWGGLDGDKN